MKQQNSLSEDAPDSPVPRPAPSRGAPRDASRRGASPRKWGLLNSTVELMRDHAIFEVPDPEGDNGARKTLAPHDREREWKIETLRLFKYRTIIVTAVAMISLPFFWALFSCFVPAAKLQIASAHLVMFACCAALNAAAQRIHNLRRLRVVSACAYIIYGMTASAVMWATQDLRVVIFSGHEQVLLSLLFVPFNLLEAVFCALMVVGTYAIGLSLALPDELSYTLGARIASMFFLGALMVVMAHLQNLLRRRAFDTAFDMAVSASKNAALSSLDAVTGGFNRRHLSNMLELELARVTRFNQPLGLVMFDLDNFKAVNDSSGHLAGDEVLRAVLSAASQTLRGIDTIARYGGDEFVIILPGADTQSVSQTAERVRNCVLDALRDRFAPGSLESRVTLSLGAIAVTPDQNASVKEALNAADEQLYRAKRDGKNRVYAG